MDSYGDESFIQTEGQVTTPSEFAVSPRLSQFVEPNVFALRWSYLSNISDKSLLGQDINDQTYFEVISDLNKLKQAPSFESRSTYELSGLRHDTTKFFGSSKKKRKRYRDLLSIRKEP